MSVPTTDRLVALARRHETVADIALAAGILLISVIDALAEQPHPAKLVIFSVAITLPLVWRRRSPIWVFAALAAIAGVQWVADAKVLADAALLVGLYTVTAQASRARAVAATAVLGLGAVLATARWGSDDAFKTIVGLGGLTLAAAGLGTSVRQRQRYHASLEERAAAAEGAPIAREMHDIVAHNLSVMIALADGAAYAAERAPAQSASAMEAVAATGRQALGEMRSLLGVLRDDESTGELAPQPGMHQIDRLVGQVRTAGLPVAVAVEGEVRELPAGAQLTVFRVVQEALTNSLKHAGPQAQALVRLSYDAAGVDVEISDNGAGVRSGAQSAQGRGLDGMRERAAVYGGTIEAGPLPTGGWRVRARLAVGAVGSGA
jgi:signal transduction histidine kinase